jgi:FlaA1/EpsC-like NDP-sugar epimerase
LRTPLESQAVLARARSWLIDRSRHGKRVVLIANDLTLLTTAVWLALSLRWGQLYWPDSPAMHVVFWSAPAIGVAVFQSLGLYQLVTRFLGYRGALRMLSGVSLAVLLWGLLILMITGTGVRELSFPRSVVFIYGLFAFVLVWTSREVAGFILKSGSNSASRTLERRRVVIYGAGGAGVRLLEALRSSGNYAPIGFIDDTPSLIGQVIDGLKVYRAEKLPRLIEREGVKEVLLALPERQRRDRRAIIRRLAESPVRVKTMPSMEDIATGRVAVTDLKPIEVDDLLGRDPVPPDPALLERAIAGKSVMVTGAGGTIGSELSRQILRQRPRVLILYEVSEAALYELETEISDLLARPPGTAGGLTQPHVVGVLGSVLDAGLLERTIRAYGVETIYHAAAYKHVPIVEANPVVGLRNNAFGTAVVADAASRCGVQRITLISTDKAVRPTNIMGASKRLAELIFQAAAASDAGRTSIFTMVRFGNVLDSSGSVVRRFKKQIEAGGPVTVTHPDVIRYFMSIPEAAELVIQASAMAKGGEVFVLDMGEPVKIDELARSMIRLMGREVADAENPDGDIAIRYVGLRPGEKLFEELLISSQTSDTEHPRIRRNNEHYLSSETLSERLEALEATMRSGSLDAIQAILADLVEGYSPGPSTGQAAEGGAIWATASRTLH